ncbi:MAG: hypothetical protein HYV32_00265 [Candidatus Kerfeldbacteria bacterium]|nr:hypothetical protein [Candidatus Kerfeldbacteria bacterium]
MAALIAFGSFGCATTSSTMPNSPQASLKDEVLNVSGAAYDASSIVEGPVVLYATDQSIEVQILPTVEQTQNQHLLTIPANKPSEIQWDTSRSIFWVETTPLEQNSAKNIYTLYAYTLETGEQQQLYASTERIHHIGSSSNGELLSFIEQDALYTVNPDNKQVHRLAQDVTEYAWSPNIVSVVYSTSASTMHVNFAANTSVASTVDVLDEATNPLQGAAFMNQQTLVGFISSMEDTTAQFLTIDLTAGTREDIAQWKKTEERFTTTISPDGKKVAVQQWNENDEFGTLEFYTFQTGTHEKLDSSIAGVRVLGWANEKALVIATPAADTSTTDDRVDIQLYSLTDGTAQLIVSGVRTAVFIDPTNYRL